MAPQKRTQTVGRNDAPQQQQNRDQGNGRRPPAHEIRCGRIKATIWENESKEGVWYSVTMTRNYKDGQGQWKSATTFGRDDLLVVAECSRMAWIWLAQQNGTNVGGGGESGSDDGNDVGDRF